MCVPRGTTQGGTMCVTRGTRFQARRHENEFLGAKGCETRAGVLRALCKRFSRVQCSGRTGRIPSRSPSRLL